MKPIFKISAVLISLCSFTLLHAYSNQDLCQFKKVIKNGWSDKNKTLNQKIINLGKIEIPRIIKNLEQPLKPDENKSSIAPLPKMILDQGDYTKLFAYTRYLESKNKIKEVSNIYIKAYKGVKKIKISSFLPLIYTFFLNENINKSLNADLNNKIFTKEIKNNLYKNLSNLLILDKNRIFTAINAEKNMSLKLIKMLHKVDGDYIIDKQHLKIYKEQYVTIANNHFSKLYDAVKNNKLKKFIQNKKRTKESISTMTHLKMKLLKQKLLLYKKLSKHIKEQDYITLSKYRINEDFNMEAKYIYKTIDDYIKLIDKNSKLLQKLKANK